MRVCVCVCVCVYMRVCMRACVHASMCGGVRMCVVILIASVLFFVFATLLYWLL